MSKPTTAHPKGRSSVIPQIEKLLTEQTSVILQAVDEKLSTQNRRIDGVERKVDKVITQLDGVLKISEDHREEDVSGAEQLRRHDDQLQDHAVRIKKLETIRNPARPGEGHYEHQDSSDAFTELIVDGRWLRTGPSTLH